MRRHLLALPAVALALAFAACGDDDSSDETAATPTATEEVTEAPTEAPTEEAPAEETPAAGEAPKSQDSGIKVTGKVGEKPEIDTSGGKKPTGLVVEDIKEGTGDPAQVGQTVSVQYDGVLLDGGTPFDNSFDRGEPFSFSLGGGQVIPGWDQGLVGMKKGGRRVLVIPSDMAYGDAGSPPVIPGGAALVFVVDMEGITAP
jgi:peptidylprolyl isomerase